MSEHNIEKALLEAILFLETEPAGIPALAKVSDLSQELVKVLLEQIAADLSASPHRGIELVQLAGGYLLLPKEELWSRLKDRYGKKNDSRLSRAALETLSIIAYSQPITRGELENIRGVSADGMIRILQERNLVKVVGKKDIPGKPAQYGTTREFLKFFRLASIADLPKLAPQDQERFELNG
ncbi:MAG: SMC-Scp complex subunit ScpB [Spirochaetales bacterium]|jgi:segregation and condensation protein B|nr:SMC-Scp complex subunit ScpB [Spirochaetales bacterium]